jgi:predicted nucleic acid-binding protein
MPGVKAFFDTNVLLYLLSEDTAKADRAEELLADGGIISVQVLNEFASVTSRKLGLSWSEIKDILSPIRVICEIEPVSLETHDRGVEIAKRYGFSFYDATIVASALRAGCKILYSEHFQHGRLVANQLRIRNPFTSS